MVSIKDVKDLAIEQEIKQEMEEKESKHFIRLFPVFPEAYLSKIPDGAMSAKQIMSFIVGRMEDVTRDECSFWSYPGYRTEECIGSSVVNSSTIEMGVMDLYVVYEQAYIPNKDLDTHYMNQTYYAELNLMIKDFYNRIVDISERMEESGGGRNKIFPMVFETAEEREAFIKEQEQKG